MDLSIALKLAKKKLAEHGLSGWTASTLPRTKRTAGMCDHGKKTIYLSVHHTEKENEEEVLDTILHEIAHALCGMLRRPHCWIWKEKFISIGGSGETYYKQK